MIFTRQFAMPNHETFLLPPVAALLDRKHGGLAICCGWNSMGLGLTRGYEMIEILLVTHGGDHNDTIVTVERKL